MRNLPKHVHVLAFALALLVIAQAPAAEPAVLVVAQSAQQQGSGSVLEQAIGDARRANPEICANCYRQLQKDNRDCESLEGQDWQVCREAASTAYRQCSQGC